MVLDWLGFDGKIDAMDAGFIGILSFPEECVANFLHAAFIKFRSERLHQC